MKLLLDTHIFLWLITADPKLSPSWRSTISDPANQVFLSAVSIWEATVKHQIGKLTLPQDPSVYLPLQRVRHLISPLPLDEPSVVRLGSLPAHHRDPFDRMLICQALEHQLTLATVDLQITQYPVPVLWA